MAERTSDNKQPRKNHERQYIRTNDGTVYINEKTVKKLFTPKKKLEFSKIILLAVMLTYFIGLAFAIYAVNKILMDYPEWAIQALIALFGYIGTPISVSIGFYSWKAKNENTKKIEHKNNSESEEEIL